MSWQEELDKYLTQEPFDAFDIFYEKTTEFFPEEFWLINEDWCTEYDGVCNKWMNKCFNEGYSEEHSALLIQRAFILFKL